MNRLDQIQLLDISLALFSTWAGLTLPITIQIWAKTLISIVIFLGIREIIKQILSVTLEEWTLRQLLAGLTGAIFGLFCANMLVLPASILGTQIVTEFHSVLVSILSLSFMLIFSKIFITYEPRILQTSIVKTAAKNTNLIKILDTNTLIDGRIEKLVQIHFVEGLILIPEFVLDELKHISDNKDELKKQRGRYALKIAQQMIDEYDYIVRYETKPTADVDQSILELAQNLKAKIMTCDQNLLSLAEAKNVPIININELAVAFQMVYLRGEKLTVKIVNIGNEAGQGLAYTEDGTMIVITNGERYLHKNVDITITRNLQSKYGIVLFADIL